MGRHKKNHKEKEVFVEKINDLSDLNGGQNITTPVANDLADITDNCPDNKKSIKAFYFDKYMLDNFGHIKLEREDRICLAIKSIYEKYNVIDIVEFKGMNIVVTEKPTSRKGRK